MKKILLLLCLGLWATVWCAMQPQKVDAKGNPIIIYNDAYEKAASGGCIEYSVTRGGSHPVVVFIHSIKITNPEYLKSFLQYCCGPLTCNLVCGYITATDTPCIALLNLFNFYNETFATDYEITGEKIIKPLLGILKPNQTFMFLDFRAAEKSHGLQWLQSVALKNLSS